MFDDELLSEQNGLASLRVELKERLVEKSESHDVIQFYTTLNSDFEKRVKEENGEVDTRNMNEKRAQKSPKEKDYQKKRGIEQKST